MARKNYYQLLEIPPDAPAEEVKRAFRHWIARYHPDKVQHLGEELQAMAADRAAELTEAYRVLSDAERRAEYDRTTATDATAPPVAATPPSPTPYTKPGAPPPVAAGASAAHQFSEERAGRDGFVRQATVARLRQALEGLGGGYEESEIRGFDLAFAPKAKLFGRSKGARYLARFVTTVDADTVVETWAQVQELHLPAGEDVCVFLMGPAMASPRELATAIDEQRRRAFRRMKPILIPVDARNWSAHVPFDAPAAVKGLLARLRSGG